MNENVLPKLESKTMEFKDFLKNDEKSLSWLKTVVAFANTIGGSFYIGVDTETKELIGLSKENIKSQVDLFINKAITYLTNKSQVELVNKN